MPNPDEKTRYHGAEYIDDVYALVIVHACPRCHAEQGEFCTNPMTHRTSRIPCKKRLAFADWPDDLGRIPSDEETVNW